jgi:hypothetical protein
MGLALSNSLRTLSTKPSRHYDPETRIYAFPRWLFPGAGFVEGIGMPTHCSPRRMSCGAADAPQDSRAGDFIGGCWTP